MIVSFLLYAVLVAFTLGVSTHLAEKALLSLGRATRWLWIGSMFLMIAVPLLMWQRAWRAPAVTDTRASVSLPMSSGSSVLPEGASPPLTVAVGGNDTPELRLDAWTGRWSSWLAGISTRTTTWDVPLALVWLIASLALALRTWRGASDLYRLQRALPEQLVAGATVRVSNDLGPAAIGGRASAIVLPRWLFELDASLLEVVVAHEQEHLRARDPRLLAAGIVALVLMPWNAGLWWAWRRLRLAIEIDCDARVLRGSTTPRAYAQLLLFISQRRAHVPPAPAHSFPAPLLLAFNPQGHHLKRRISAMTARSKRHPTQVVLLAVGLLASGSLAFAIPAPRPAKHMGDRASVKPTAPTGDTNGPTKTVVVNVTRLGLTLDEAPVAGRSPMEIVLYGEGPVRVGIGGGALRPLTDTLRLDHLPAFSADVTSGAVHVEMRRVAGLMELGGEVTGGPMTTFSVRARHVVLSKGGNGVRGVPATRNNSTGSAKSSSTGRLSTASSSDRAASNGDAARLLADSLAVRITLAELKYAMTRVRFSDDYPGLLEAERNLESLQRLLETLPPSGRARVRTVVLAFLDQRRVKLNLDRDELLTKYSPSFPTITEIEKEVALLDTRLREIRDSRVFAVAPRR